MSTRHPLLPLPPGNAQLDGNDYTVKDCLPTPISGPNCCTLCKNCNKELSNTKRASVYELQSAFVKQRLTTEAYHPQCVQCWRCNSSAERELCYVEDKLCCWKCSLNYEAVNCTICKLLLADVDIEADTATAKKTTTTVISTAFGKVHKDCFRCVVCDKQLNKVYYINKGQLFCQQDYLKRFAPVCRRCFLQILPDKFSETGKFVVAQGQKYHLACWLCQQCRTSIYKKEFCRMFRQILCLECGNKKKNELEASNQSKNSESSQGKYNGKQNSNSNKQTNNNNDNNNNSVGEDLSHFFKIQH